MFVVLWFFFLFIYLCIDVSTCHVSFFLYSVLVCFGEWVIWDSLENIHEQQLLYVGEILVKYSEVV